MDMDVAADVKNRLHVASYRCHSGGGSLARGAGGGAEASARPLCGQQAIGAVAPFVEVRTQRCVRFGWTDARRVSLSADNWTCSRMRNEAARRPASSCIRVPALSGSSWSATISYPERRPR